MISQNTPYAKNWWLVCQPFLAVCYIIKFLSYFGVTWTIYVLVVLLNLEYFLIVDPFLPYVSPNLVLPEVDL